MDPDFYKSLHKFCFLVRDEIYDVTPYRTHLLTGFSNRLGEAEKDPFIGFVGENYFQSKKKVLIMGRSNAQSSYDHYHLDMKINESFKIFKSADSNYEFFYRKYADSYVDAMPAWRIYKNLISYFLRKANLDLNDICYVNSVPFRYGDGKRTSPTIGHYEVSYKVFTNKFISLIRPNQIIPLGINDDKNILDRCLDIDFECTISRGVERTNGDHYLCEQGKRDIEDAYVDFNNLQ